MMTLCHHTRAAELLRQLIELERAHGHATPETWDIVKELRTHLEALATGTVFSLVHNSRDLVNDESYWTCISELRRRGDQETFDTCAVWVQDQSQDRRQAAADILAELGYLANTPYSTRSWPLLEPLLADSSLEVIASALAASGKLNIGVPATLAAFATHADVEVRRSAVTALSGRDDPISNSALVSLSRDPDPDIRNWATFGLAQLTEFDTPELREALLERLADDDPELASEIRGEALIGLATRRDFRVLEPLKQELSGEFHGAWCIKAAHVLMDPVLVPLLTALKLRMDAIDLSHFGDELDEATAACARKSS